LDRVEIITGVERRRRYSDEERAAVLAMCDEPKATIVGVAKRLGMAPGLIHGWRRVIAHRVGKKSLAWGWSMIQTAHGTTFASCPDRG
jgi:transposase-like protein